jgi:hypothetical protein
MHIHMYFTSLSHTALAHNVNDQDVPGEKCTIIKIKIEAG